MGAKHTRNLDHPEPIWVLLKIGLGTASFLGAKSVGRGTRDVSWCFDISFPMTSWEFGVSPVSSLHPNRNYTTLSHLDDDTRNASDVGSSSDNQTFAGVSQQLRYPNFIGTSN